MKDLPCKKEMDAIQNLQEWDTAENMITTLDEFFEEWLCSERITSYTSDTRAAVYTHYKSMRKFLKDIQ